MGRRHTAAIAFAVDHTDALSTGKRWPAPVARGLSYALNAMALLQPVEIAAIAPMLALEITRSPCQERREEAGARRT